MVCVLSVRLLRLHPHLPSRLTTSSTISSTYFVPAHPCASDRSLSFSNRQTYVSHIVHLTYADYPYLIIYFLGRQHSLLRSPLQAANVILALFLELIDISLCVSLGWLFLDRRNPSFNERRIFSDSPSGNWLFKLVDELYSRLEFIQSCHFGLIMSYQTELRVVSTKSSTLHSNMYHHRLFVIAFVLTAVH